MSTRIDQPKLNVHFEIKDLTQGDIENFYIELRKLKAAGDSTISVIENSGQIVRSAFAAKLVKRLIVTSRNSLDTNGGSAVEPSAKEEVEAVSEFDTSAARPAVVSWLAAQINDAIKTAVEIPPP